jgi:hypothetical protein
VDALEDERVSTSQVPRAAGAAAGRAYAETLLKGKGDMGDFAVELWMFMPERKKFWLLPIVLMLVLFGGLLILTHCSAMAPFIYTPF